MNSTTLANKTRVYFVYYDSIENGIKPQKTYSTNITYTVDNTRINITNTLLRIFIDTNRGENTSGIYRVVERQFSNTIISADANARTSEYIELSNGTHNLSFNLIGNFSFINGSIRLTIIQEGNETVLGNMSNQGQLKVVKKYYIYNIGVV